MLSDHCGSIPCAAGDFGGLVKTFVWRTLDGRHPYFRGYVLGFGSVAAEIKGKVAEITELLGKGRRNDLLSN